MDILTTAVKLALSAAPGLEQVQAFIDAEHITDA